ncbi:MAG: hypothetical protein V3T58_04115 [Candidatus Hydrothermarchaeales archaeon]
MKNAIVILLCLLILIPNASATVDANAGVTPTPTPTPTPIPTVIPTVPPETTPPPVATPMPESDLQSHLNGLSLSSEEQGIAGSIVTLADTCYNLVLDTDYYSMNFECMKSAYMIRKPLQSLFDISKSDWKEVQDYIMIKSKGEPNYWTDGTTIHINNWKEMIPQKLHFSLNRYEDPSGNINAYSDLNINWRTFSLTEDQKLDVERARRDFWEWEDEQRKREMLDRVSVTVSGESERIAKELIALLNDLRTHASAFDSSPSSDSAYALAYAAATAEMKTEGYRDYDYGVIRDATAYVVKHGSGTPQVWEDEFGDVNLAGLTVYESSTREWFSVNFNRHVDRLEKKAGFWIHINWDETSRKTYQDAINRAWNDAREEVRRAEMDEKIQKYLNTFTISDENEEIAKDVVEEVTGIVDELNGFSPSADSIYGLQYKSALLRAKVNGLGDALRCDDLDPIASYIMIYTPGTVELGEDEYGKLRLIEWKNIYTEEPASLNFNWGCKEVVYTTAGEPFIAITPRGTPEPVPIGTPEEISKITGTGFMSINLNWRPSIFDNDAYREAVKRAEEDAWKKAERLRKQKLLIEAKKRYSFTSEQEAVGKAIVGKTTGFEAKLVDFENTGGDLYKLYYDYILLNSEVQGMSQAHRKDSRKIGIYVILNGPGVPDIWKDEYGDLEVGHGLIIHEGKRARFAFNRWYDEKRDEGDFFIHLDMGELSKSQKEVIRQAERDAWEDAEQRRRKELVAKIRGDLHPGKDADLLVGNVRDFIILVKKYRRDEVTTYDVELRRLELNQRMKKLDQDIRDYIMISDLGEDSPLPHMKYDYETGEISIADWRDLLSDKDDIITGIGAWCKERQECALDLSIRWRNWESVRKDIERANEHFWREQREKDLSEVLTRIIAAKDSYSTGDQQIEGELVNMISGIKTSCQEDISPGKFLYSMLLKKDELNDLLDKAEKEDIIGIALAESQGYHSYDKRADAVRSVMVCTTSAYDVNIVYFETFVPPFVREAKEKGRDLEVNIEVQWKSMDDALAEKINSAFKRYEKEQTKVRLQKLIEKRADVVNSLSKEKIKERIDAYEAGSIGAAELRRSINELYFTLEGYDTEIAYLAAISGEAFPEFTSLKVEVETDHVDLKIWEDDFEYKFEGGLSIRPLRYAPAVRVEKPEIRLPPPQIVTKKKAKMLRADVEITEEGMVLMPSTPPPSPIPREKIEEAVATIETPSLPREIEREVEVEVMPEDVAAEIREERLKVLEEKERRIEDMRRREGEIKIERKLARSSRGVGGERLKIDGIKPRLKLKVSLTDAEILRLAEELKAKWLEAQEAGIIDEMINELNLGIENFPAIQEAIREWSDTTTSVRITHKGDAIFEFSFRTENGKLAWARYNIADGAGNSGDNIYIKADFASLMKLRNWWEGRLKNAEGPVDLVVAAPVFGARLTAMVLTGGIKITPFGAVLKIPRFLKVFFDAIVYTTGVSM